jgi:dihydrofolate reductase
VFIGISLDGFIARTNGDLDWLPGSDGESGGEDYGFQDFFSSIDTVVMGRHTYEFALTFKEWPYRGKRVVVLSSGHPTSFTALADGVDGISSSPEDLVSRLASQGSRHAYIDGGKTIQGFLRAGLIRHITITRIPVLIGVGIPLFGPTAHDIHLRHVRTTTFDNGFVQSTYMVPSPV